MLPKNRLTITITTILFIAIIYFVSQFQFHVSSPIGDPFVQLGEAVGVLAVLFLGLKLGLVSSLIGILMANIVNNPHFFYLPILEMLIIALIANLLFNILGRQSHWSTILTVTLGCGITKIITTFLHFFIQALIVGQMNITVGIMGAFTAMPAGIITAIMFIIIIPISFFILARTIFQNFK